MQTSFPNIRHMRVFLEVARTGSVSLAAESCNLSQPAATQAISRLEANLGASLLLRKRGKISLTPSGEVFKERAIVALKHLSESARAARRIGGLNVRGQAAFDHQMTVAQLRNLIAIANHGSFTVAAHNLNVSQPTVHRAARNLEAVAGVSLFNARATGVGLTAAAEALVLGAKLAFSEIKQGMAEVKRELGEDTDTFILGSMPLARTMIVPKAVHATVDTTNGFQVRVVDGRYSELLRSLREGDLDCLIGALRFPPPSEDVEQETLFRDELAVVVHPRHPLALKRNVSLEDTMAYPWVAPPRETPAGTYLFETLKISSRPQTPVRVVSSSLITLRGILAQGNYVSIVSRHQVCVDEQLGTIKLLNVPLTGHSRDIGLTYRKNWRPTAMQAQFIEYLRRYSRET